MLFFVLSSIIFSFFKNNFMNNIAKNFIKICLLMSGLNMGTETLGMHNQQKSDELNSKISHNINEAYDTMKKITDAEKKTESLSADIQGLMKQKQFFEKNPYAQLMLNLQAYVAQKKI